MDKRKLGIIPILVILAIGWLIENGSIHLNQEQVVTEVNVDQLLDNKLIEVDSCDLSGDRLKNAKVDIGMDTNYADRDYFGYTNSNKQLVYVHADNIIAQNDTEENGGSNRYCRDEAKVEGVENDQLDEGHVIADSLGGVSNAYNITPQNSYLNRFGTQAELEDEMREALYSGSSVTNFNAYITYEDKSMIPTEYQISYEIDDTLKSHDFINDGQEI
ncbi:MAG: DNA/RNA non-specific endonuclease [Bacilli bacterium]